MEEIRVENSKNVLIRTKIDAQGNVSVGDRFITNVFYSPQYKDLKDQHDRLEIRFSKAKQRIERFPDDEDFKTELLQIDEERKEVQKKLKDLKDEVIRLAETFTKIPLNTERLKLARQHFEAGDYAAARVILDAEEMGNELDALLDEKQKLQERQAENEANLIDKANDSSSWRN